MRTIAQEVDYFIRRPAREGSIGFCIHCRSNVRGVIHNHGYEYAYQEDNVCPEHRDRLLPVREESEA